jgi:hypothetical protein
MKTHKIINIISILFVSVALAQGSKSFYDYSVTDIFGKSFNLSSLKGKKVLVVNTASKCGNTPQFAELEKLYKDYGSDKFVVIGFPANNFCKSGARNKRGYSGILPAELWGDISYDVKSIGKR